MDRMDQNMKNLEHMRLLREAHSMTNDTRLCKKEPVPYTGSFRLRIDPNYSTVSIAETPFREYRN